MSDDGVPHFNLGKISDTMLSEHEPPCNDYKGNKLKSYRNHVSISTKISASTRFVNFESHQKVPKFKFHHFRSKFLNDHSQSRHRPTVQSRLLIFYFFKVFLHTLLPLCHCPFFYRPRLKPLHSKPCNANPAPPPQSHVGFCHYNACSSYMNSMNKYNV